jgi:hypothetical protein
MFVTYEGTVSWETGGGIVLGDDDYSLNVVREDLALYTTAESNVHIEFDASETVDNFGGTNTWWETFQKTVDRTNPEPAHAMIDGHFVIVTGMLGLDSFHDGHTELHPVHVMFVLVGHDSKLRQTTWAFFVRNWGNEGSCGDNQVLSYFVPTRVQIDGAGRLLSSSSNVWGGARNADDTSALKMIARPNGAGMLLTFDLLDPDKQSWIEGDLTFEDRRPVIGQPEAEGRPVIGPAEGFAAVPLTASRRKGELPPDLEALQARIAKLPADSQRELFVRLQNVVPRRKSRQLTPMIITGRTRLGTTELKSPRVVVGNRAMPRQGKDSTGELRRQKQLEVIREFLAEKGV